MDKSFRESSGPCPTVNNNAACPPPKARPDIKAYNDDGSLIYIHTFIPDGPIIRESNHRNE